jgi:3-methyladenine DNA glycosylase AlkD
MTKTEVIKELKASGTEQTRKTYRRHGMVGEIYGASYATLGKMKKKIKVDQPLAEQLWATGAVEACSLATMIADPSKIKVSTLDAWAKSVKHRGQAAELSNLVAEAPAARKQMEKWTKSKQEMIGCTGWHTLASMARQDNSLPDAYFETYLETIEATVHDSKNWVKYSMNNALISIGVRSPGLQKKAMAAAKRIGPIHVDHGDTSCKTPEPIAYIKKTVAHQKKMQAKRKETP